jgi:hypothetical protein
MAGVDLAAVQRVYDEALARVHDDLPDYVADVVIDVRFDGSDTPYRFVEPGTGYRHERDVPLTLAVEVATMELADRLQDDVIETWRKVWPECPGHPHPMKPTLIDRTASWACPAALSGIARIGDWKH